ncbi:hypothetical protein ElyMa_001242100 [Elysia marginata]|uniref:Uncharacterized protein n=1 Tax=Elysia marginata TaxID=1093978 RepID=A0AAV4I9Z4_9GAST|nr:hypothetical protein ElyMa_001242100 [Elysia marginata]
MPAAMAHELLGIVCTDSGSGRTELFVAVVVAVVDDFVERTIVYLNPDSGNAGGCGRGGCGHYDCVYDDDGNDDDDDHDDD